MTLLPALHNFENMFLINNYSALQRDVVHDQDDEQEQEDAEEARAIAEGIDNQVSLFFRGPPCTFASTMRPILILIHFILANVF